MLPLHRPVRVLLVEDDLEMRRLLGETLVDAGFDVLHAADGAQALGILGFDAHGTPSSSSVEVIVADVRLPTFTGLEIVEAVRAVGLTTSVIVISAFADEQLGTVARRLGVETVLAKPFPVAELVAAVQRAITEPFAAGI